MDLPRDFIGDVFWPVANIPSDVAAIELKLGSAAWLAMTTVSPNLVSAYLAGPDAASSGATTVPANVTCRIRVKNAHYSVPVMAGQITLV